jgi:hypothetical protein
MRSAFGAALALAFGLFVMPCAGALDDLFDVTLEVVDDLEGLDVHVLELEALPFDSAAQSGAAADVSASATP